MLDPARVRAVTSSLRIAAMGTYVPERRLTNADLARSVDTTDDWIVSRTGMRERRIARDDEFTSDMCLAAVRALERNGGSLDAVDFVIACTVTPDYAFPSVAARVQEQLGLRRVGAIDLGAACAGFMYGLDVADALLETGRARNVLLVAGESLSKITDYTDRSTCILFGDGAAAALVTIDRGAPATVLARRVNSDGAAGRELFQTGLRSEIGGVVSPDRYLHQNGRAVYEWALTNITAGIAELLAQAEMRADEIDWFVPHSANGRMIESIAKRAGIARERMLTSYELHGNTSSASIPLALAPAIADGRVKRGNRVMLYGFGGGLVECGMILRWS
ncbi:3-oxoacyl-[acyl-carrier-protein] synthase 3 protein 2 [Vulcanimicrobium alpinum]|uniref:Beta-ketoacyl-[acyl-carrier-protein] synthase III n=1 Tax=Vulcanimicrobium alpinum TaxID=3016050 RepID=A0AAN1XZU5_UNVUL|nr:3-oxoacyl-[acyl-carrier-protein] synthase 3 protein 2 [Vulcanimicrobium alpinum]